MINQNVFMIGWEYPPYNSGGLGVACQGLTKALSQDKRKIYFTLPYSHQSNLGHIQVIDCYHEDWFDKNKNSPPMGVYSSSISAKNNTKKLNARQLGQLPQSQLEQKVSQYADLVGKAAKKYRHDFDVIHAHDWMSFLAAQRSQKTSGKPYIAHVHSTEFDRIPHGHGSKYIQQTEKQGMENAIRVIAVSNYTRHLIANRYGINLNKIDVVHNGIDPLPKRDLEIENNFAAGRPIVVFMGRLTMQKGAEYFVKLAQKVSQVSPRVLFIVAGSGDQYHSLLLQSSGSGLSANLLFAGFLRGKLKKDLLNRANVFIMPSLSEPFGLVALEAAQRQTPVIVSKNSGVAEVLPSAIVTDFWDIDLMSQQIIQLISDQEMVIDQTQKQLKQVSQITWRRAADRVNNIYRQIFSGH